MFESHMILGCRIVHFCKIQAVYMPIVLHLLSSASQATENRTLASLLAENLALWMPSDVLRAKQDSLEDEVTADVLDLDTCAVRRLALLSSFALGLVAAELQL